MHKLENHSRMLIFGNLAVLQDISLKIIIYTNRIYKPKQFVQENT